MKQLGPYHIIDVIGRGGMGTVFRAEDLESGQVVAVKALAPTFSMDPHFRARFESEIQALMKLDHPNIVRLISFGQEEGSMFFAMELVEGKSLHQELKERKSFDWRDVLDMSIQVCTGLRHAHDRGIIHRDLKPGNLLLSNDGIVKLTDFGIAKAFGGSELTGEGNVLGTMDFMAPEQAAGKNVTVRSDLYSLGTVMYALLAGKPPFHAKTLADLATKFTTHKTPRISKVVPTVPKTVDRLIDNLLQKNPQKRIATSYALGLQLKEIQTLLQQDAAERTAVVSDPSESGDTISSAVDHSPLATRTDTGDRTSSPESGDDDYQLQTDNSTRSGTMVDTLAGSQTDYFKQITPQTRTKVSQPQVTEANGVPAWLLACVLALVLAVAGAGVFWATRRPSAESLIATVEATKEDYPGVLTEIEQLIEYYPDHERKEEFVKLRGVAEAMKYRNTIQRVATGPRADSLSPLENQFLKNLQACKDNLALGYADMLIWIENEKARADGLSEKETRCVEAGECFLFHFERQAAAQNSQSAPQVEQALQTAVDTQNSQKQRSELICQVIVKLYQNNDWAEDIVLRAEVLHEN